MGTPYHFHSSAAYRFQPLGWRLQHKAEIQSLRQRLQQSPLEATTDPGLAAHPLQLEEGRHVQQCGTHCTTMEIAQLAWEQLSVLHALAIIAIDLPWRNIITTIGSKGTIRKELDLSTSRLDLHVAIDELIAPAVREYATHLALQQMIPGLQEDVVELVVVVLPGIGLHFQLGKGRIGVCEDQIIVPPSFDIWSTHSCGTSVHVDYLKWSYAPLAEHDAHHFVVEVARVIVATAQSEHQARCHAQNVIVHHVEQSAGHVLVDLIRLLPRQIVIVLHQPRYVHCDDNCTNKLDTCHAPERGTQCFPADEVSFVCLTEGS